MQSASKQESIMSDQRRFFADYMEQFEQKVMIPCAENELFKRKIMVSTRTPKLRDTAFGQFIGPAFKYDGILAFNYYGLTKVSTGFQKRVQQVVNDGMDVKAVETLVVYFAAIKMKNITDFAPDLVLHFTEYKEYLVALRDFPDKP